MSKRAPILITRKGIEILFGLVTFAILARTLTKEQFAIYSLILGFVSILRLTALPGLGTAVLQAFARGLSGEFRYIVKLSFFCSFFGAVMMLGVAWWHFCNDDIVTSQTLLVAAIFFPFVVGLTLWRNAAVGDECYLRLLWFDSFTSILKCAAIIICAYFFTGALIPVVIAAFIAPGLVNVLATLGQLRKESIGTGRESNSVEYGIRTTIYQLPTVLAQQLDKLALFYFISPEAMAIYAVALRIPELARTVVGETNATLGPVFAREKIYTRSLYHFSLKLWLLYSGISVAGALFVVPYLLPMLAGESYKGAVFYAQIMTVGVALGYLGDIQFRYVKSHLHSQSFFKITIATALFDCVLILGLAYYFGLAGVVSAYVVKNFGYTMITNTVIRFNYLKVKVLPPTVS